MFHWNIWPWWKQYRNCYIEETTHILRANSQKGQMVPHYKRKEICVLFSHDNSTKKCNRKTWKERCYTYLRALRSRMQICSTSPHYYRWNMIKVNILLDDKCKASYTWVLICPQIPHWAPVRLPILPGFLKWMFLALGCNYWHLGC